MTAVQASIVVPKVRYTYSMTFQDIFIIPDGAAGALAELERRKFTAEEGVCESCVLLA
jgi:hypothetical protein